MTKIISILIIVFVVWGGYEIYVLWDNYDKEQDVKAEEAKKSRITSGEQLSGLPYELSDSLRTAEQNGPTGLRNWLKAYGTKVEDPRRAWIELDYVVGVSRQDPVEAKKVFQAVKERVATNSPVYPRIKELEKTYD